MGDFARPTAPVPQRDAVQGLSSARARPVARTSGGVRSGAGVRKAEDRRPAPERLRSLQRVHGNRAAQRWVAGQGANGRTAAASPTPTPAAVAAASRGTQGAAADSTPRIQRAWYNVDIPFTDYRFDPSLAGVKTAANVVKDAAVAGVEWIVDEIRSLVSSGMDWLAEKWRAVEGFASSALEAAGNSFRSILGLIGNPLGFLVDAFMSLDAQAVGRAWAAFSVSIAKVANGFKAMTDNLVQQAGRIWSGIEGFAASLLGKVSGLTGNFLFGKLPDVLQRIAHTAIARLQGLWASIQDRWTRLSGRIKAWIDAALDRVFGFVRKVLSLGIGAVIAGIAEFAGVVRFLKDLFADPQKYIEILARRSVQAFDGVEGRFASIVGQHFAGPAAKVPASSGTAVVQRAPAVSQGAVATAGRGTATWHEIGQQVLKAMDDKWKAFLAHPMVVIKALLMDLVLPMVGNVKDVVQLFKDIRSIVTGPLKAGSLEEAWTSLLQILEIPILIYRTVTGILMRTLMLPLIVASFVRHPVVTGIAATVGYVLLGAFVQAEALGIGQKLLLLKTGATDGAQKEEAYNRIADSLIALAMTAAMAVVMLILHFVASLLKGVYNFVKGRLVGVEPLPAEGGAGTSAEKKGGTVDGDAPESRPADPAEAKLMETGHKDGVPADRATPREAAEGSIRMAEDPRFPAAQKQIADAGFELRIVDQGSPRVVIKEVYAPDGKLLRTEKYIYAREGMRFLDLEHEIGHMRQMVERFGGKPPATERVVEMPDGTQRPAKDLAGTLTNWQNAIVEFHNRLVEWLRLRANGAAPELLREHARGVAEWRELYLDKGLKGGRSPSQKAWAEQHFPDIADLVQQYEAAGGGAME